MTLVAVEKKLLSRFVYNYKLSIILLFVGWCNGMQQVIIECLNFFLYISSHTSIPLPESKTFSLTLCHKCPPTLH